MQARRTFRFFLLRRGLVGWRHRVVYLQGMRVKMLSAARVFMFGALARCFASWRQHAAEQVRGGGGSKVSGEPYPKP